MKNDVNVYTALAIEAVYKASWSSSHRLDKIEHPHALGENQAAMTCEGLELPICDRDGMQGRH